MNKPKLTILILSLSITSCDHSTKKAKQIENEPVIEKNNPSESEFNIDIESILVQGENEKFLIRVERSPTGEVTYQSWSKSKTIHDKPDITLTNGIISRQGTGGGYHYTFKNGEWKYIIENNQMGETEESIGLFLRLMQNDSEKLYSRLKNTSINDSEKRSYVLSDLIGRWWTPHYAVRKIEFFNNNRFKLNDGSGTISKGNFTFSDRTVTLSFDSKDENIAMKLGGGKNDYSYTLIGDGENFVKER